MLEIFIVEDNIVRPTTTILLISPFKEIWERDKDSHKGDAINEFTYIEFMVSPLKTNPYRDYKGEKKHFKLSEKIFKKEYKPDKLVKEACELYIEWIYEASFSYQFLEAAKRGALAVKEFLNDASKELKARLKSGGMVIKPSEITRALKDTEEVLKNIQNLEKKVFDELSSSKTQSDREINEFEK